MTSTPGQRDFPGGNREETRVETAIVVQGAQGGKPQTTAANGISKIVVRASGDYDKKQEEVSVDDEMLLELEVL